MIYKFLFPTKPDSTAASLFLLALRILFGVLLMSHGVQKLISFHELSPTFPDPLGVGSTMSLVLAIFGELVCSMGFIIGLLYRLALIPMIFTMSMAFFVIHESDAFFAKELPFIYLAMFVLMYIAGPGKFSVDYLLANEINHKKQK